MAIIGAMDPSGMGMLQQQQMAMAQQQQMMAANRFINGLGGNSSYNPEGVNLVGTEGYIPAQPGTLYINDSFVPSSPSSLISSDARTHGDVVAHSARSRGFDGPIVGNDRTLAGPQAIDFKNQAYYQELTGGQLTPEQTTASLQSYMGTNGASLLQQETRMLDRLVAAGATNSVVNFSQGASKASAVRDIYLDLMPALSRNADPNDPNYAPANTMLSNIARAANLDMNRLTSSDQEVRESERGRMTQFLIDQADQGLDSNPDLQSARRGYDVAVRNFEARHNSVVIGAGNEGEILSALVEAHGGYDLQVPADFSKSILENDEVTSVGSTQLAAGGEEQRAGYTSNSTGIDIYASGETPFWNSRGGKIDGTSFAAPEVAAEMAQLHRDFPNLTSAQVENLLRQRSTHQLTESGQTISVLDSPSPQPGLQPTFFMQNPLNGNFFQPPYTGGISSGGSSW